MAEQVSHNVVNHLESTSGSPLVDGAANQTTANSADSGTTTHTHSIHFPSKHFESSESAHESENPANEVVHGSQAGSEANPTAAEPSAGDVVDGFVKDFTTPVSEKSGSAHGDHEDVSVGDGHLDDRSTADVSVDFSVNSDTDNSRADAGERKDKGSRLRKNSMRKPATFSKVSVTKNFMAKTATATPVATKLGEKSSAVLQPTAKPRLVAKSAGSSLRNLQKARSGPDGNGGPDASKVWNKNRPVQPPPPRQFTDEELKQQYGIHLATRLQTDESGKESKWADIDDDEDDWAPETVVWMDGTKSTLTPQDAVPPEQEKKPAAKTSAKTVDAVKPTLTSMKRPDQNMTILKPGAAAAGQVKQGSSAAPSPGSDKPSLKVKGPLAVPPTKSPWAPVPKIESVSPVNPPVQQPQARPQMAPQDARAYESAPPPAAREIAADTFDRSWREGEGGTRELFNSANGRYEPAPDGRPNMSRLDASTRKPAVLQRPTQGGPPSAEPSAAFQGRTGSQLDGMWGRRRGSSVSQGSVPPARRLSTNTRVSELLTAVEHPDDAAVAESPAVSSDARVDSGRPDFAQQSAWSQQMPPRPVDGSEPPATPMEDALKRQDRVMREKRELAIKRRQEEEAREEAAKQERLKAKLAALEDAGKSRKEREAEAAAAAAVAGAASPANETTEIQPTVSGPGEKLEQHPEPAKPTQTSAAATPVVETRSKATTTGPVLSKQASPHQKATVPSPLPSKSQAAPVPERPSSSSDLTQRPTHRAHMSPRSSARAPYQPPSTYKGSASSYSSPGERKPQPYGRSPIPNESAFTPWPTTAPSGNVWGTAGIGNGTFESSSSYAPVPMSQQSSSLPPPPGMARPATSTRISPQGFAQGSRSPGLQQSQPAEQQRAFPPPGIESRPDPFGAPTRLTGVSPVPALSRPAHPPGPIGPPSRSQQQQPQQQQPQQASQRSDPIAIWNQAAQRLPTQFSADAQAAYQRRKQEASVPEPPKRTFKETFKQTVPDPIQPGGGAQFKATEHTVQTAQGAHPEATLSPAPPNVQTIGPLTGVPSVTDSWRHPVTNQAHAPESAQDIGQGTVVMQQPPIGPPIVQQPPAVAQYGVKFTAAPLPPALEIEDSTPPPPETESHPVNSGTHSHPLVKLPPPQAKVKLPPMAQAKPSPTSPAVTPQTSMHTTSVMMPQRPYSSWAPPGVSKPIVMNEAWQARFNGLFNRTPIQTETPPSPPKTPPKMQGPTLAVTPSSRALMDYQANVRAGGATVSLPQVRKSFSSEGFTLDGSSDVFSKPTIDHVFNEELSFGSLPKITIPRNTSYDTSEYPPNTRSLLSMSSNSKIMKSVDSQSLPEFERGRFYKHKDGIFVRLLGTRLNNKLIRHDVAIQTAATARNPLNKSAGRFSKFKASKESGVPASLSSSVSPRKTTPSSAANATSPPAPPSSSNASTDRRRSGPGRYNRGAVQSLTHASSPTNSRASVRAK